MRRQGQRKARVCGGGKKGPARANKATGGLGRQALVFCQEGMEGK